MNSSIAHVETDRASVYLQQLCKHFAHKMPVVFTPTNGTIPFSSGTCLLQADDAKLTLKVEAEDTDRLGQVQDVVERHLVRFAFRSPVTLDWRGADDVAGASRA